MEDASCMQEGHLARLKQSLAIRRPGWVSLRVMRGVGKEGSGPDILERFLGQLSEGQSEKGRDGTLGGRLLSLSGSGA